MEGELFFRSRRTCLIEKVQKKINKNSSVDLELQKNWKKILKITL